MKLLNLLLEESTFDQQAEELEQKLQKTYNRKDISVEMGQYDGRDKGFGKVTFYVRETLPEAEWRNIKNTLEAKKYQITQDSNWYEEEPGERRWYPHFKFEFDIVDIDEEVDNPTNRPITPGKAGLLHKFLSDKLGDSFTSEFPLKSDFFFQLEKAGL